MLEPGFLPDLLPFVSQEMQTIWQYVHFSMTDLSPCGCGGSFFFCAKVKVTSQFVIQPPWRISSAMLLPRPPSPSLLQPNGSCRGELAALCPASWSCQGVGVTHGDFHRKTTANASASSVSLQCRESTQLSLELCRCLLTVKTFAKCEFRAKTISWQWCRHCEVSPSALLEVIV